VETGTDGNVYATQYPKYCYTGQTSTDVTSPGGSMVLTADSKYLTNKGTFKVSKSKFQEDISENKR
jgi:hypothetical protein